MLSVLVPVVLCELCRYDCRFFDLENKQEISVSVTEKYKRNKNALGRKTDI